MNARRSASTLVRLSVAGAVGSCVLFAVVVSVIVWAFHNRSLDGTWKATDEYGGEHYFKFNRGGTFTMWDRDRQDNGSNTKGAIQHGRYWRTGKTAQASVGFGMAYQGSFEFISNTEFKHDYGFGMRSGLTFRRVAEE